MTNRWIDSFTSVDKVKFNIFTTFCKLSSSEINLKFSDFSRKSGLLHFASYILISPTPTQSTYTSPHAPPIRLIESLLGPWYLKLQAVKCNETPLSTVGPSRTPRTDSPSCRPWQDTEIWNDGWFILLDEIGQIYENYALLPNRSWWSGAGVGIGIQCLMRNTYHM